jgi:putative glutamine amidotransferase
LLESALNKNLPILGICNGMQLINVFFGGTLMQHIPDSVKTTINHEQPEPKSVPSHAVNLTPGTLCYDLCDGEPQIWVNSTHHQAVEKIGESLIVSGTAPDGIIEAIEAPNYNFVVGVEWHAEHLNTKLDKNLFARLITAAGKHK